MTAVETQPIEIQTQQRDGIPVSYTPGLATIRNFLSAAMQPVGKALYVFGGAWNREDTGGGEWSVKIGLSDSWGEFFDSQDESYTYEDYKTEGCNEYCYAGIDCSGFVGWSVYNALHSESGGESYVTLATQMARTYAEWGWGEYTREIPECQTYRPGDIVSIKGHVWISLGTCEDGSVVIAHSTPSKSKSGFPGGGVQVSGMGEGEESDALRLAEKYMAHCQKWSERYVPIQREWELYTSVEPEAAGRFRWYTDGRPMTDPDGVAQMSAEQVFELLVGEDE